MPRVRCWYIVEKDGKYLGNTPYGRLTVEQWSCYFSDAVRFAKKRQARKMAKLVGGMVVEIAPVDGGKWNG